MSHCPRPFPNDQPHRPQTASTPFSTVSKGNPMQFFQPQQSTPATTEQIAAALQILFNSMRFPPGVDAEKAVFGYVSALQGFPVEAIAHGIRKFLRGEAEGVSPKFCPHPPELAAIVRSELPRQKTMPTGRLYRYRAPKSAVLERRCTKDWARQLVNQGVHPRGSIWCPGPVSDKPEIGDLFAPDENWKEAVPLFDSKTQSAAA